MHTKFERLLPKSLTTLEVMTYYLVVHTGPGRYRVQITCNTSCGATWYKGAAQLLSLTEFKSHDDDNVLVVTTSTTTTMMIAMKTRSQGFFWYIT